MKINFLFLLVIYCSVLQAQKPCGNPKIDMAAMQSAEANIGSGRVVNSMIRVYFHILKDNNGTNPAASLLQIQQEFQQLQNDFAPHNICFAFMGVDSINNTFLNNSLDSDIPAHVNLLAAFNVPNCINIYYSFQLPKYGGNSFNIPNNFCIVASGNINVASTISHEVGHCMGLSHTFETAMGEENINGTNCSTTGDRVCDTPADPLSFRNESCFSFSASGCMYTGSCTDPNGATNFNPPYNNIMSYWGLRNCTVSVFTAGQYSRFSSFLISSPLLIATISVSNYAYGPENINAGTNMISAVNNITSNGVVQLSGSVRATLQARVVKVVPGFKASPTSGKIILRPATCNY